MAPKKLKPEPKPKPKDDEFWWPLAIAWMGAGVSLVGAAITVFLVIYSIFT